MRACVAALLACLAWTGAALAGDGLEFSLHRLESGRPGNTLLVVGGIQGDEPGGFNAASVLVSHYRMVKGSVWVVPNLNFISIIKRSRGVHGDLNRKFSTLRSSDPEYAVIEKIKSIIMDDRVDAVLNLHDGSGFYRPQWEDRRHNPSRWGQSVIVDQERLPGHRLGDLSRIAGLVAGDVNRYLYEPEHAFHVKNTETGKGDVEMAKTLTYFAIRNHKPAFGLEVSKSFPTHLRAFYHLRMVESFMNLLGIEYHKGFPLAAESLRQAIDNNLFLALFDRRIVLDLRDARDRLDRVPIKKGARLAYAPSSPIMAVVDSDAALQVFYGNRNVTSIDPHYVEYDSSTDSIAMEVDGHRRTVGFGQVVGVNHSFRVFPRNGYRVNLVGYRRHEHRDEADQVVCHQDFEPSYSVDRGGAIYRVEVFRGDKFSGMVLVDFAPQADEDTRLSDVELPPYLDADAWHSVARAPADSRPERTLFLPGR